MSKLIVKYRSFLGYFWNDEAWDCSYELNQFCFAALKHSEVHAVPGVALQSDAGIFLYCYRLD